MQVGSLVMYIGPQGFHPLCTWIPEKNDIYTVRQLLSAGEIEINNGIKCKSPFDMLRLEEGEFGFDLNGVEIASQIKYWKEIQPPMDVKAVVEEALVSVMILEAI